MSRRVTIKSIAIDLGVSHMTVSRALSGHPNVQKATREAILLRAKELGYVKSAAASAMRGDGTMIVGLLLPNIVNEFYARFANTLARLCAQNSFHLNIHLTDDNIEIEHQSIERLREIQAMAVVMVPSPCGPEHANASFGDMKVVQLIRERSTIASASAILVDDRDALLAAVEYLSDAGHQSIAYIGGASNLSSGRERLEAFRAGLEAQGLCQIPEIIVTDAPSFDLGRCAAEQILKSGVATALVSGGVEISNGALSALMDCEYPKSGDFAFVGYGEPSFYCWVRGGVSTISIPVDQLANKAIDLLKEIKGSSSTVTSRHKFNAHLNIRNELVVG